MQKEGQAADEDPISGGGLRHPGSRTWRMVSTQALSRLDSVHH
jgi:hypothetical protein